MDVEPGSESGYFVSSMFVALAPGESSTLSLVLVGPLDVTDSYRFTVRTPPTVAPTRLTVNATWRAVDGTSTSTTLSRRDPGIASLDLAAER